MSISARDLKRRYFGNIGCPNVQGRYCNSLQNQRAWPSRFWPKVPSWPRVYRGIDLSRVKSGRLRPSQADMLAYTLGASEIRPAGPSH